MQHQIWGNWLCEDRINAIRKEIVANSRRYINNTKHLLEGATPDIGKIVFEQGATLNTNEQNTVDWLLKNIGGNINVLSTSKVQGIKTPDLFWRGEYVDIKHVSGTLSTLDTHIRKGIKQTNKGGIVVDITGAKFSNQKAISTLTNRLVRNGGEYALVIRDSVLVAYIYLL